MQDNKGIIRDLFNKYFGTLILSELAFSVCTVIDGMLSGQYLGNDAIAAIGIASPFPSIIAIFSGVLSAGCQARVTYYMGRGEKDNANTVYSTVVLTSLVVSAVVTAVFVIFTKPIAIAFGAGELLKETSEYLLASSLGTVGMIMYTVLCPIVQLEGKHNHVRVATYVLVFMNIGGDLLNMFVIDGGLFGIGLATAISNVASTLVLVHALRSSDDISFRFSMKMLKFSILPELLYIGSPKAVRRGCNALRPVFMNRLVMAVAGAAGVSALSVQGNMRALSGTVGAGIAGTVLLISGVFYAENDINSIKQLFREANRKILLCIFPLTFILVVLAPWVVKIYMPEHTNATDMAITAVRCYSLALPFVAFNEMYINYFQATGRTKMSGVISAISRIGAIFVTASILAKLMGILGVWIAIFASEALLSAGIMGFALLFNKNESLEDRLLFIGHDKYESTHYYDAVITSREDALGISESIYDFCKEHGTDERRSYLTSLFCEEHIFNLIGYGFEDGKPHYIDLRLSLSEDEIRIRMRDNCRTFNPQKWYELNYTHDAVSNIGIKIVLKMSTHFEYTTTFRMNNVIITI